MKFTFYMNDIWGDDYEIAIESDTEERARKVAMLVDDDAVPGALIRVEL